MSVRVWKDVLYTGRQQTPAGLWFTITQQNTQAAARNCKRMIGRGVRVPCVWEHQPGANPIELSQSEYLTNRVKGCFGEIRDARVDPKTGVLWMEHEVYDPADADLLREKRLQVSPKLFRGFSDSKGGNYRGTTVAHVAATTNPVQFWQRPFELSQGDALLLSYGDPKMAKDKEDAVAEPVVEAPPVEETGADDADLGDVDAGENDVKGIQAVINALRETGMNIPEEVSDWQHLVIAIKAGGQKGGDQDGLNATAGGDATQQAGGGPPMMMSDARMVERERAISKKELKADVKSAFKTGRCTRDEAKQLLRKIDTVELSYFSDGKMLANETAIEVGLLGKRKAWSQWSKTGTVDGSIELSNTEIEHPPTSLTDNSAGTREATEAILARIPGPKAA